MRRSWLLLPLLWPCLAPARTPDLSALPPEIRAELLAKRPGLEKEDLNPPAIDEWLKRIAAFPSVEQVSAVALNGGVVRFEAQLLRKIGRVTFSGLSAIGLSDARTAFGLAEGETYDMNALVEAAARLQAVYRGAGVLNPIIDVETPSPRIGVVDLDVKIREGARTLIGSWTVQSPDADLNERYRELLTARVSGAYTDEAMQRAQKLLRDDFKRNGRLRAEIGSPEIRFNADESRADITLRLMRIESYAVTFRGNRALSGRMLENDVLNLKDFTTTNPNITAELTDRLRQAYLARGFARVEIRAEVVDGRTPYSHRIDFEIDEGPKVKIDKIEVNGRVSRDSSYYAKLLEQHASPLVADGFYNKDELDTAYKNLTLELQNQGYLVAKIISTRAIYSKDKTRISIHINLDEGPLTLVEGVVFEGNARIPAAELMGLLDLERGGALKLTEIDRSLQLIRSYYQDHGFIEMQFLNGKDDLVAYNQDNTRATLTFRIQEGPQVSVASILLDGNTFTKDYVIMNELDFSVGDILTPAKIDESIARLQRTGYFGDVQIRTLEANTSVENRTVIVRVTERNPGVFQLGAGATNENRFTLRGYTGVAYRNLWGTGRGVSARVDVNYNTDLRFLEQKITLGYVEPYLFMTRNRGRVTVSRSKQVMDYTKEQVTEANQATYSVERDFTSHILGIWNVLSITTYNDFSLLTSADDRKLDIFLTGLRLDVDYRDNPFNPMRGHMTQLSLDYSPGAGNRDVDAYYQAGASYRYYLNWPGTRLVWANMVRGGYLKSLENGRGGGIPYDKIGYILGGTATLRGYEYGTSDVFPNSSDLGGNNYYLLQTAAVMGLIKSEVRFPLWGESLDGVVFYDGGSVRIEGMDFTDSYRDSAGFGFRYNTPVGPVSLEFAWKLDMRPGEAPWRFHFAVGSF